MPEPKNSWVLWVALSIVLVLAFPGIYYTFRSHSPYGIEGLIVTSTVFFLPPLVLTFIGWKLSSRIKHPYLRQLALTGVIALIFTPYMMGHSPFPAILVFMLKFSGWALLSILAVWLIIFSLACGITWLRIRKLATEESSRSPLL
ncbi:MAG: hypothetical protein NTW80_14360 [Deltaproteobacteria bacterium]|nr:hypothetical protein [Deltaproteobacteria bacterium]